MWYATQVLFQPFLVASNNNYFILDLPYYYCYIIIYDLLTERELAKSIKRLTSESCGDLNIDIANAE